MKPNFKFVAFSRSKDLYTTVFVLILLALFCINNISIKIGRRVNKEVDTAEPNENENIPLQPTTPIEIESEVAVRISEQLIKYPRLKTEI